MLDRRPSPLVGTEAADVAEDGAMTAGALVVGDIAALRCTGVPGELVAVPCEDSAPLRPAGASAGRGALALGPADATDNPELTPSNGATVSGARAESVTATGASIDDDPLSGSAKSGMGCAAAISTL